MLQKKYRFIYHNPKTSKILKAILLRLNLSIFRKVQKVVCQFLNNNLRQWFQVQANQILKGINHLLLFNQIIKI